MAEVYGVVALQIRDVVVQAVQRAAEHVVQVIGEDLPDPGPRAIPRDLRLWLGRLRLLSGVPFGHLVADPELTPPESIRFFYVDRDWTDAIIQGALSVGTVTTQDHWLLQTLHGVVRNEVDEAERLVRLPGVEVGAAVPTGVGGPLTGFVLRSRMVSGWPALHVRAYGEDNLADTHHIPDDEVGTEHDTALRKLGLLRLERLAPAVLLAIFDGIPAVVHIEEPRAGIQFGVEERDVPVQGLVRVTLDQLRPFTLPVATRFEVPDPDGGPATVFLETTSEVSGNDLTLDVPVRSTAPVGNQLGAGAALVPVAAPIEVRAAQVVTLQPSGPMAASVFLRSPTDGTRLQPPVPVPIRFRADAPGVLHLQRVAKDMVDADPTDLLTGDLDAAEFALQMLQFPFRAVFGDRTLDAGEPSEAEWLFRPTLALPQLLERFVKAKEPRP